MIAPEDLKLVVKEKYASIAEGTSCCCGPCGQEVYSIMHEEYNEIDGHMRDADLGLGCGTPTLYAHIRPGETVLDLGSGAGNDAFIAMRETGAEGRVIGIDFTEAMIVKANENKAKLGAGNVEFRHGDIESMPVDDASVDVVLSNCVLNLVPDKERAFAEIARVLRPGGRFAISDVVLEGTISPALTAVAELYAGCVSGAIAKDAYLGIVRANGFESLTIETEKEIVIPEEMFRTVTEGLPEADRTLAGARVLSITLTAVKSR